MSLPFGDQQRAVSPKRKGEEAGINNNDYEGVNNGPKAMRTETSYPAQIEQVQSIPLLTATWRQMYDLNIVGRQVAELDTLLVSQVVRRKSIASETCSQCGIEKSKYKGNPNEPWSSETIRREGSPSETILLCPTCKWLCNHKFQKQQEFNKLYYRFQQTSTPLINSVRRSMDITGFSSSLYEAQMPRSQSVDYTHRVPIPERKDFTPQRRSAVDLSTRSSIESSAPTALSHNSIPERSLANELKRKSIDLSVPSPQISRLPLSPILNRRSSSEEEPIEKNIQRTRVSFDLSSPSTSPSSLKKTNDLNLPLTLHKLPTFDPSSPSNSIDIIHRKSIDMTFPIGEATRVSPTNENVSLPKILEMTPEGKSVNS